MNKQVYFRTDANVRIGYGHLARCLILGAELKKNNFSITFLLYRTEAPFRDEIMAAGYGCKELSTGTPDEIIEKIHANRAEGNLLIIDSDDKIYYETLNQEKIINAGIRLVFFTFWDVYEYRAHLIINQNPMSLGGNYRTAPVTRKLLGPEFMIFSDHMVNESKKVKKRHRRTPGNLLIAFGGSDQADRTLKTLKAIRRLDLDIRMIHIVTGNLYPHQQNLSAYLAGYNRIFKLHTQTNDMAGIMSDTDLAICAGGLTLWELALFRIPTAIISWSERERTTAEYLQNHGLGYHLGSIKSMKLMELSAKIANFAGDVEAQKRILTLRNRIDADGKKRIVKEIINLF